MGVEYHEFPGFTEMQDSALEIPRAKALCNAVYRHKDVNLIAALKGPSAEVLIVDMECDGVPSKNARLALRYLRR